VVNIFLEGVFRRKKLITTVYSNTGASGLWRLLSYCAVLVQLLGKPLPWFRALAAIGVVLHIGFIVVFVPMIAAGLPLRSDDARVLTTKDMLPGGDSMDQIVGDIDLKKMFEDECPEDQMPKYTSAEFRTKSDAAFGEYDPENTGKIPDPIENLVPFMAKYGEGPATVQMYVTQCSKHGDEIVDKDTFYEMFKILEWYKDKEAAEKK